MNDINLKVFSKIKNPKTLVLIGVLGIALIFLSSFFNTSKKDTDKKSVNDVKYFEYQEKLENDVLKIVKEISGDKKASVVITFENGIKYSYADTTEKSSSNKNESNNTEIKEGYITVKTSDGGEQALLITEEMPEVRGVAIVCLGGDDENINFKIQNTVMAALNITSNRVYICGRNN